MNWTQEQEQAFSQIMAVGLLERLPAIRLYRRSNENPDKALKIALAERPSDAEVKRRVATAAANRERAALRRMPLTRSQTAQATIPGLSTP